MLLPDCGQCPLLRIAPRFFAYSLFAGESWIALLRSSNDTSAFCFYVALASSHNQSPTSKYIPRGRNHLHTIFEQHFAEFCDQYEDRYAKPYGLFRLERIHSVGEKFCACGDYLQGIARIRCTNPECGHDYFRRGRPVRLAAKDFTSALHVAKNARFYSLSI